MPRMIPATSSAGSRTAPLAVPRVVAEVDRVDRPHLETHPLQREDRRAVSDVPVGHRRLYRKDIQPASLLLGPVRSGRCANPTNLRRAVHSTSQASAPSFSLRPRYAGRRFPLRIRPKVEGLFCLAESVILRPTST